MRFYNIFCEAYKYINEAIQCLLQRCLINTRLLFPMQMGRVVTPKNSIFQSCVWPQDTSPSLRLLPFPLLSVLETEGSVENPVIRERDGSPSTGWFQAPSTSHLGLCGETFSRTHDPDTIIHTLSLRINTYWPYVADMVLPAGSWGNQCLVNGESSTYSRYSRGLPGIPCILPNWRGWTRWCGGPLSALKSHSALPIAFDLTWSCLNSLIFYLQ